MPPVPIVDLPALNRGRVKTLPPIWPTDAQAVDLYRITLPLIAIWTDAKDKIMAGYDPKPFTADTVNESKAEIEAANNLATVLAITLEPRLREYAVRIVNWHREKFAKYVFTATSVDLNTVLAGAVPGDTIETFVARNVSLIKSINDEIRQKIADSVFRGFQERTAAEKVAKEISEHLGGARKRARRIAIDQLQKLSAQLDTERFLQVGIEKWEWRHSGKLRFRPTHLARDGVVYTWDNPPSELPGELPFCGCKKRAVID